mgnify:CR=1 FL=1
MKLKLSEIQRVYAALKQKAQEYYQQGEYVASWLVVREAVDVIQQFSWEYCDDELEVLLEQLSKQFISDVPTNYQGDDNRVVVVDDWCTSYVLVMQYIDALVAAGKEILYITSKDIEASSYKNIIPTIKDYPKLTYCILPAGKQTIGKWSREVYEKILDFYPAGYARSHRTRARRNDGIHFSPSSPFGSCCRIGRRKHYDHPRRLDTFLPQPCPLK